MKTAKEIIDAIESIEKEKNDAVKEAGELRVKVWKLEQELAEQKKEVTRWKNVAFEKEQMLRKMQQKSES